MIGSSSGRNAIRSRTAARPKVSHSVLVEPGDASAPRGSRPWCLALYDKAVRQKKDGKFAVQELRMALMSFRDGGFFRVLTDNQRRPFQTFEEFVRFREPFGLGMEVEVADAIFREPDGAKTLDQLMDERRREAEKARQDAERVKSGTRTDLEPHNPVMRSAVGQGNSAAYLLRRLARQSPETLAAYEAGQFGSVKEAARAAGIPLAENITLGHPETVAQRIADKGPDYARAVAEALDALLSKPSSLMR